jgi:hypothetical protein
LAARGLLSKCVGAGNTRQAFGRVADCEAVAKIQKLVDDIVFHRDISAVTTLSVSFFISLFSFEYRCSILNGARAEWRIA